MNCSL